MWLALVRHAAVDADPDRPATLWPLSDAGRHGARALARLRLWRQVARIFSSPETRAQETAQIVAGRNGITVTVIEDLREVERPAGRWFADYRAAVAAWFAHPNVPTHGWEPAAAARARIAACIASLRAWEPDEPVAVVGHGLTLALYLGSVVGADPAAVWPAIALPDVAVVDPDAGALRRPFGRFSAGVSALAPTAWDGDHPIGRPVP